MKKVVMVILVLWMLEVVVIKVNMARFKKSDMDNMVVARSEMKVASSDPCKYQVTGDPNTPDKRRVRVNFVCSGVVKVNTLAIGGVPDNKATTILNEVARLDGFNKDKVYSTWKCGLYGKTLTEEMIIKDGYEITCIKE